MNQLITPQLSAIPESLGLTSSKEHNPFLSNTNGTNVPPLLFPYVVKQRSVVEGPVKDYGTQIQSAQFVKKPSRSRNLPELPETIEELLDMLYSKSTSGQSI
jgi:hypothetical protein